MSTPAPRTQHLFVVRTWQEPNHVVPAEQWRGSVEHVPSGQRLYFTTLDQLNQFVATYAGWQHALRPNDVAAHALPKLLPETVQLVQESMRELAPKANQVAQQFYNYLLAGTPELRAMFPSHMEEQARKFVTMLTVVVEGLDHFEKIVPILQNLGYRHVGYGVTPHHYQVVGDALLATLGDALGSSFTPELRDAWAQAYSTLATTMLAAVSEMPPPSDAPDRA